MINLLYTIYNIRIPIRKLDSLLYIVMSLIINKYLNIYVKPGNETLIRSANDKEEFIVSLTTFPARIDKVWLTIESIFRQKEKPDRIILWLYQGEFPNKNILPKQLLQQEERGLEIRFCDENLKPHKKYFYTLKENPNDVIITIDDDFYFPPSLISTLKKYHNEYPDSIICPITREIKVRDNKMRPYKEWNYVRNNEEPSLKYLTMGGGGTLFPPNSFHKDVLDIALLKKMALTADDLWLKVMSLRQGTKVKPIGGEFQRYPISLDFEKDQKLTDINVDGGENNIIFKNLTDYFNIKTNSFK